MVTAHSAQCRQVTELSKLNKVLSDQVAEYEVALEDHLRTAEELARLILDRALDAVITTDSNDLISSWNEQAEEIFGWPRSEVINKRLADTVIPPAYRDAYQAGLKHFLATGEGSLLSRRTEITALHRDGREFPIELSIAALKLGDRCTFGAFVRDLTESKRVAEALRQTQEELAWTTRLTAMGQLSASIAHEIKQPLAAIVTNTDTCLYWLTSSKPDIKKAGVTAKRIARDAKRASDILSRIRSLMNKTVQERTLLDINYLIQEALDLTHGELRKRHVSVQTELANPIPAVVGDRVQLQQVLLNLVLNSIEAMTPVQDRPRILGIRSQLTPHGVEISLHDTGVGLDPATIQHVFDAFFTTKSSGTGMGLSICRSILDAHGGRIWALSRVPHGAVFRFSLPRGDAP